MLVHKWMGLDCKRIYLLSQLTVRSNKAARCSKNFIRIRQQLLKLSAEFVEFDSLIIYGL